MNRVAALVILAMLPAPTFADQTVRPDGMGGWIIEDSGDCGNSGFASGWCRGEREKRQQQLQQQQLQLQQEQLRNQQLQNELLQRQLDRERQLQQTP